MRRVFIDTNILLDLLLARTPHYLYGKELFALGQQKKVQLILSTLSVANAQYALKKIKIDVPNIRAWLRSICSFCELASLSDKAALNALASVEFEDIEDGMQYMCAVESGADVVVTRNEKDFKHSQLPVMSAQEFLLAYLEK